MIPNNMISENPATVEKYNVCVQYKTMEKALERTTNQ